jgi:diacylglycerol kinase (ATP)
VASSAARTGLFQGSFAVHVHQCIDIAGTFAASRTSPLMAAEGFRGPKQVWNAFLWSMKGLRAGWRHEASFRLEACLAVVLIPLGLWLGHGGVEKFILILAPMLVLSAELLNSAIEAVVDKVSPEFNELAGRAKDMGSAAVFVLLVLVVLSWALILGPRFFG